MKRTFMFVFFVLVLVPVFTFAQGRYQGGPDPRLMPRNFESRLPVVGQEYAVQTAAEIPPLSDEPLPDEIETITKIDQLKGKRLCDLGFYSTREQTDIELNGGVYRYNYGADPIWSGRNPDLEYKQVGKLELHQKLSARHQTKWVKSNCDYRITSHYTVVGQDISGKHKTVSFGSFAEFATWAIGFAASSSSTTLEFHVAVKQYMVVKDAWDQEINTFDGMGHNLVFTTARQGFFSDSFTLEFDTPQPIAQGAALEIATGVKSEATLLAESNAANTDAQIAARRAKIDGGTASTRAKTTKENEKARKKAEKN